MASKNGPMSLGDGAEGGAPLYFFCDFALDFNGMTGNASWAFMEEPAPPARTHRHQAATWNCVAICASTSGGHGADVLAT